MTTETLRDLISKLEAAEGPDRELDGRIAWVLGWRFNGGVTPDDKDFGMWPDIAGHWHKPGDRFADIGNSAEYNDPEHGFPSGRWDDPPPYTASLDAAVGLVPEGWAPRISKASGPGRKDWSASVVEQTVMPGGYEKAEGAATGALALCIAALKAREQQDG